MASMTAVTLTTHACPRTFLLLLSTLSSDASLARFIERKATETVMKQKWFTCPALGK